MFECYEFEECEYNGQPKCCLPDDVDCPHGVKNHKPTNADSIRSMSDEEMAKWFLSAGICVRDFEDCQCDGVSCRQCRLNWLQQPAEEDN